MDESTDQRLKIQAKLMGLAARICKDETRLQQIRIVDQADYNPDTPEERYRLAMCEATYPGQIHTLIVCRSKPRKGCSAIGTVAEAVAVHDYGVTGTVPVAVIDAAIEAEIERLRHEDLMKGEI